MCPFYDNQENEDKKEGRIVPNKRLSLCSSKLFFGRKKLVRAQYLVSKKSREEWVVVKKHLPAFVERMKPYIVRLRRARFIRKVEYVPKGIIRWLRRVLR